MRYEDDFGSFWMVDDSEFVKRRHLSRGRPRKYEPSSSPNSNSQQFANTIASAVSCDAYNGNSIGNDPNAATSPDPSTDNSSHFRRVNNNGGSVSLNSNEADRKNNCSENNGGNDDYDICEVSQRSPAGYQIQNLNGSNNTDSGYKHSSSSSKQRSLDQRSIIGIAIKTNFNSMKDRNCIFTNRMNNSASGNSGVVATNNNPGIGGISDFSSIGSLDIDNNTLNISNANVETEDTNDFEFQSQ